MRKRYIEDLIFCWLTLSFKGFFSLFPYKLGVSLGAGLIYLFSFLYPKRFDIAYINLKSAFPDKKPSQIKWIVKRSVFNLGLSLMEFILSFKLTEKKLLRLIKVEGLENLEEEYKKGKGLIFLTAHFDNWELLSLIGAILGYPSFVVAREQKYPRVNNLLNRYRARFGNVVVKKGLSIKKVLKALKDKKCIGILADQNAGKNGIQVKFFGKYVSTNPGFIELAEKTKSVVFPIFLKRVGLFRHILRVHPKLNLDRPRYEIVLEYNSLLESYIREKPEQWLWFHKRWKHSSNKNILLLSDGKPGHYKQSCMVVEQLKNLLCEKMYNEWKLKVQDLITVDEVTVEWSKKGAKNFLYFIGLFSNHRCQGCLRCLKWALAPKIYDRLANQRFDYIVSAGSSLLALNALLSYENRAVNINVLSPGRLYRKKFDLVFLPEHDNLRGENIALYRGALTAKALDKAKEFLNTGKIQLEENVLKIGILIGGGTMDAIKAVIQFIDSLSLRQNINLLVTTSRRTPSQIEKLLQDYLCDKRYLRLLILASQNNPVGGYDAILYLSDVIIVTSDSISMISEALEYEKKVFVYDSGETRDKNRRFISQLLSQGLIELLSPHNLKEEFKLTFHKVRPCFSNIEKVQEALGKLL